jgi:hypothetical protein
MEDIMKELQFSIEINATKERIWSTLWDDQTFRDWANNIDEGTYMKGEMKEGNEIEFISSVNGYGVSSLIENMIPNEYVFFKHYADTQESGQKEREKEWSGLTESYSLTEINGITTLVAKTDVPEDLVEMFTTSIPKALARIKTLAESK